MIHRSTSIFVKLNTNVICVLMGCEDLQISYCEKAAVLETPRRNQKQLKLGIIAVPSKGKRMGEGERGQNLVI